MLGLMRFCWVLPRLLRRWGRVLSGWLSARESVVRLWVAWMLRESLLRGDSYDGGAYDGVAYERVADY